MSEPVRKSITVKAGVEHAFHVFTDEIDSWWPRTHHIGKSPISRVIVQGRAGGRCYSEQVDGTDCDWGSILLWDPPRRFVMAWQVDFAGRCFQPDLAKSSEVEVSFTPEADGQTRVDLEHRYFERHGEAAEMARAAHDSPMGWNGLLGMFAARAEKMEKEKQS